MRKQYIALLSVFLLLSAGQSQAWDLSQRRGGPPAELSKPAQAEEPSRHQHGATRGEGGSRPAGPTLLWLSDSPPPMDGGEHGGHGGPPSEAMKRGAPGGEAGKKRGGRGGDHEGHGGPVEMGKGGLFIKTLFVRGGTQPMRSKHLQTTNTETPQVKIQFPDGSVKDADIGPTKKGYGIRFEMPQEGYYNVYLTERLIEGDTLHVMVAKAEVLKHNCGEGHGHVRGLMPVKTLPDEPVELVRQRIPDENFHTLISGGDDVTYSVLYNGRPVKDAQVKLTTKKGWTNTQRCDESGNVTYEMIRDYYPEWEFFKRREKSGYLAVADFTVPEGGEYNGVAYSKVHYMATLAGNYYPSKQEYQSYAYGMGVTVFAFTVTGGAVWWQRARRRKPFKEITFKEE
ncbi:MAG: hypothetical protein OEV28_07665 [Nitrospirota bacterium]|nr:hypothetical protein [Nitrospirota bacterium]